MGWLCRWQCRWEQLDDKGIDEMPIANGIPLKPVSVVMVRSMVSEHPVWCVLGDLWDFENQFEDPL